MDAILDALKPLGIAVTTDRVYVVMGGKALPVNEVFKGMGINPSPKGLLKVFTRDSVRTFQTVLNNQRSVLPLIDANLVKAMREKKAVWVTVSLGQAAKCSPDELVTRWELANGVKTGGIQPVLDAHKIKAAPTAEGNWIYKRASMNASEPVQEPVTNTVKTAADAFKDALHKPARKTSKPQGK